MSVDNNSYIDRISYEVLDEPTVFVVDKLIAPTISVLNKLGYRTIASCEGHDKIIIRSYDNVSDMELYNLYKDNPHFILKEMRENDYDYWEEVTGTTIYVAFKENYEFKTIPDGFIKRDNVLSHNLEYYKNESNKRRSKKEINEEINLYNKILYEWAKSQERMINYE